MGKAKNRGNQDQRIAEARVRERTKFPASVKCNSCQAELTDIEPMNVRGFPGLKLAGAAECRACETTTWVLHGTQEAMDEAFERLESVYGRRSGNTVHIGGDVGQSIAGDQSVTAPVTFNVGRGRK